MIQSPDIPISQHVYKIHIECEYIVVQTVYSFRPKAYKLWTNNTMTKAINAVVNDGLSI